MAYVAFVLVAMVFSAQTFAEVREPVASEFADQLRVVRVVDDIEAAVEAQDWTRVRTYFADAVVVDFSAVVGGEPVTMRAEDLIAARRSSEGRASVSGVAYGNHQVLITGDEAIVLSKGNARSFLAMRGEQKLADPIVGSFRHTLQRTVRGWRVVQVQFTNL
jgi:ketosteroid isomerase-like protein